MKKSGFPVTFYTNGLALTSDMIDTILEIGVDAIYLSITGFSADTYNQFQGSGHSGSALRDKVYDIYHERYRSGL